MTEKLFHKKLQEEPRKTSEHGKHPMRCNETAWKQSRGSVWKASLCKGLTRLCRCKNVSLEGEKLKNLLPQCLCLGTSSIPLPPKQLCSLLLFHHLDC